MKYCCGPEGMRDRRRDWEVRVPPQMAEDRGGLRVTDEVGSPTRMWGKEKERAR